MPCTASKSDLTPRDRALHLYEAIPPGLFRVDDESERIAWRVSPEPFALTAAQLTEIEALGHDLLAFYRALNSLYNRSARGTAPAGDRRSGRAPESCLDGAGRCGTVVSLRAIGFGARVVVAGVTRVRAPFGSLRDRLSVLLTTTLY